MKKNWTNETAEMLKKVNEQTRKLIEQDLPIEEFHKRHQEILDFWESETKRLQNKYPLRNQPKARPKSTHTINHMSDKFYIEKLFRKFNEK